MSSAMGKCVSNDLTSSPGVLRTTESDTRGVVSYSSNGPESNNRVVSRKSDPSAVDGLEVLAMMRRSAMGGRG